MKNCKQHIELPPDLSDSIDEEFTADEIEDLLMEIDEVRMKIDEKVWVEDAELSDENLDVKGS